MNKLRSFIYLDNYKMYSISSQLFEGLTDYIIETQKEKSREEEHQKGPHFRGKMLADIIEVDSTQHEKKFLHDYSYNLIEEELEAKGKILDINAENIEESIEKIGEFSFLKITSKVIFNDMKMMEKTTSNFNHLGASLGYITQKAIYDEEMADFNNDVKEIKDRNQKAKLKNILNNKASFEKHLDAIGLRMDPKYIEHMTNILDFGYNQQFEIQMPLIDGKEKLSIFSAQLIRENLKEDEYTLIKKYSRQTEREFTLFGILTQKMNKEEKTAIFNKVKEINDVVEDNGMKGAIMNLISHLTGLEATFTGKLDHEYTIDPIAVYVEI